MNTNLTLFAQIIQSLSRNCFKTLVKHYETDKHYKGIDSWTHLISMLFCQFSKLNIYNIERWIKYYYVSKNSSTRKMS
jgi:hypothetical protein